MQNEIQSHGHEYSTGAKTLEETTYETPGEDRATAVMSSLFRGLR